MTKLDIESLSNIIPYLEDIFTARTFFITCKKVKFAFEKQTVNPGYTLTIQLPAFPGQEEFEIDEDEQEELIEKRFHQELSLFSSRSITQLTKETVQFLPSLQTPAILPLMTSKPINLFMKMGITNKLHKATIKYVISCVSDRSQYVSLEPFKEINHLHIIIDDIYRVELNKIISKSLKITKLTITFKMTADIDTQFFNEFDEYHIQKVDIICKRKQEIDRLLNIQSVKNNKNIRIISRFWYKGIEKDMIIWWKPNVLYMTEDGVVEVEILQNYNPWNLKFVELPVEED